MAPAVCLPPYGRWNRLVVPAYRIDRVLGNGDYDRCPGSQHHEPGSCCDPTDPRTDKNNGGGSVKQQLSEWDGATPTDGALDSKSRSHKC
jgi:hypothetical protein